MKESLDLVDIWRAPDLGASLDGIVFDPTASVKQGGLEVKCPHSKSNMSKDDACSDKTFYLTKSQKWFHYV